MSATPRTLSELQALLANNTSQAVGAGDAQDFLVSVCGHLSPQVVSSNTVLTTDAVAVHVSAAAEVTLPAGTDGAVISVTRDIRDTHDERVWISKESARAWTDLATSADNKYQLAILSDVNPYIYISDDYGETWFGFSSTAAFGATSNLFCTQCGMSDDGSVMAIAHYNAGEGAIRISTDYGATWTPGTDSPKLAVMLTVSPDGTTMLANNLEDDIYMSTTGGSFWGVISASWVPEGDAPVANCTRKWKRGCISADNQYMLVTVGGSSTELTYPVSNSPELTPCNFDIATNRVSIPVGMPFTEGQYIMFKEATGVTNVYPVAYDTPLNYYRIRTGSTLGNTFRLNNYAGTPLTLTGVNGIGSYQRYGSLGGRFWVSQDFGATFREIYQYTNNAGIQPLLSADIQRCAMSSTGQYMVVASRRNLPYATHYAGLLYVSNDYGTTWRDALDDGVDHEWAALDISADGSTIYAAIGDLGTGAPTGYMWSSYDYGVTWHQETVGTDLDWQGISMSADASRVSAIKLNQPISVSNSVQKAPAAGVVTLLPSAGKTIRNQDSYMMAGNSFTTLLNLKSNNWYTVHESVVVEKTSNDFSYYRGTSRWFTSPVANRDLQNSSIVANTLYAVPFLISGASVRVNALGMYIRTTYGGGFIRLGIYTNTAATNTVNTLVIAGSPVAATAGFQSTSITLTTLSANTLYWLVCLANNPIDIYAHLPEQQLNILGYDVGNNQGYSGYTAATAYGALPASFPAGTLVSAPNPSMFVKRQ